MSGGVRLDKWLWAARFFRTRAQAKTAIDGGKVVRNGVRAKAARPVEPGDELRIRQGFSEKTVVVIALAEQRRGAPEAAALYEETQESLERRAREADLRRALRGSYDAPRQRPDKRQRRALDRLKREPTGFDGDDAATAPPPEAAPTNDDDSRS